MAQLTTPTHRRNQSRMNFDLVYNDCSLSLLIGAVIVRVKDLSNANAEPDDIWVRAVIRWAVERTTPAGVRQRRTLNFAGIQPPSSVRQCTANALHWTLSADGGG